MGTKIKKMKTERKPAGDFLFLSTFYFKYLKTQMITVRSKVYVCYLYMYKSIIVYIKNKKRRAAYIIVPKGTFHFKYASKE